MLGDVRERLGHRVVDARLERLRQAVGWHLGDANRNARALAERAQRRPEAALGEHGRVDALGELAQLVQGGVELALGALEQRDRLLLAAARASRARVSISSAIATRCCWAPSWRLRSSRRRSRSAASTSRCREDRSSASARLRSVMSRR